MPVVIKLVEHLKKLHFITLIVLFFMCLTSIVNETSEPVDAGQALPDLASVRLWSNEGRLQHFDQLV